MKGAGRPVIHKEELKDGEHLGRGRPQEGIRLYQGVHEATGRGGSVRRGRTETGHRGLCEAERVHYYKVVQ